MDDDHDLLLFTVSQAEDEPERATVPFIAAATAVVSGRRAVAVATIEGVLLGLPGVADRIEVDGMPPLADLQRQLVRGGVRSGRAAPARPGGASPGTAISYPARPSSAPHASSRR